jgi:hypothetical protein
LQSKNDGADGEDDAQDQQELHDFLRSVNRPL